MTDDLLAAALRLHRSGNLAEAGRLYSDILRANPNHVDALYHLGLVQFQFGRFADAEHLFAAAIRLNPQIPDLFYGRGCAQQSLGRLEEALASFARALSLRPDYLEARNNRGVTLLMLKRFQEALAAFEGLSTSGEEGAARIFSNRAAALFGLKRHREALEFAQRSLALRPDFPESLSTYAAILTAEGRYEEALAAYDRAVRLKPDFTDAINHRGSALRELGRLDEALASYDRALELKPDFAEAHNNRGMLRLLLGRYREGWLDHDWRWDTGNPLGARPKIDAPPWRGEDIGGRRIAIYCEQGFGDTIQFARYLPLLIRRGACVTLFAPARLVRLLRPVTEDVEVATAAESRGPFDFQCALLSLPLRFGTELHTIPAGIPYLHPEPALAARWKARVGAHGFKIGIAWQGAPEGAIDRGRSIPLAEFAPLARVPGIRLISLQKTHGLDQLADLPNGVNIETLGEDFDAGQDGFIDTAAVMSALDLIVTSDTSVAHLAGALGRPTWVALKCVPDWRWLLGRDDSPWYPTMRLFRQQTAGDWRSVFARIEQALWAETSRPPPHPGLA